MLRDECMWFVQQFDSFLNLGICKEYPMARSKSTSGGKSDRSNTNTSTNGIHNDQISTGNPANIPDVKAVAAETASEVMSTPEPRKLEVVRTESRKNGTTSVNRASASQAPASLVSSNLEDEIRRRAYELYLRRGTASGSEAEDWLTAEREITQRYRGQIA
jgi:hypothetical protein